MDYRSPLRKLTPPEIRRDASLYSGMEMPTNIRALRWFACHVLGVTRPYQYNKATLTKVCRSIMGAQ